MNNNKLQPNPSWFIIEPTFYRPDTSVFALTLSNVLLFAPIH
jgi:hypothetical protein